MAIYIHQDIATTFDGDLELSDNGDVRVGTSLDTYKAIVNFMLRTDFGDYAPDTSIGCNLGSFVGELNNSDTHQDMEYNINRVLQDQIFSKSDVSTDVVAMDVNDAVCIVNIAGHYIVDNQTQYFDAIRLMYSYPYIDGEVTPLTIQ